MVDSGWFVSSFTNLNLYRSCYVDSMKPLRNKLKPPKISWNIMLHMYIYTHFLTLRYTSPSLNVTWWHLAWSKYTQKLKATKGDMTARLPSKLLLPTCSSNCRVLPCYHLFVNLTGASALPLKACREQKAEAAYPNVDEIHRAATVGNTALVWCCYRNPSGAESTTPRTLGAQYVRFPL